MLVVPPIRLLAGKSRFTIRFIRHVKVDRSNVPEINEADLQEVFISGSGPGGQKVNKATNCCQLKHKPTGIVVKVHQSRNLATNRSLARELLQQKLDNLYNGENSVEAQKHRLALRKFAIQESQAEIRRNWKQQYKDKLFSEKYNTSKDI